MSHDSPKNYTRAKSQSLDETLYPCKLGIKFNQLVAASQARISQFNATSHVSLYWQTRVYKSVCCLLISG